MYMLRSLFTLNKTNKNVDQIKINSIIRHKIMNSLQNAQHVINLIVKQSKQKIQQNKIVKTMSTPYSNALIQNQKNDIMLHAGISFDKPTAKFFKKQINSQQKPYNNIKDTYSFFSVKKYKQDKKQNSEISLPKQQITTKPVYNFVKSNNTKNRQNQVPINKAIKDHNLNLSKQDTRQSSFLKLQQKEEQLTPFLVKQDKKIDDLRGIKHQEVLQLQTQRKKEQSDSQMSTERQNKLTVYLQSHLSRQNNHHTYDIEGNLLLFSSENNNKAIKKAYPPTIRYDLQNKEDDLTSKRFKNRSKGNKNRIQSNLQFKRKQKLDSNTQGVKGEIFKSSVLKTINLSRLSFGNQQFDEGQFMKRNDFFNNNHLRQTTSIPFMKMECGSLFKQTATNQCISNKDTQTQAESRKNSEKPKNEKRSRSLGSRYRNEFKKFSLNRQIETCSNSFIEKSQVNRIYPGTSKNSRNINSIGDTRYSSFYVQRPYTTQVGRIKRENDVLFHSMLQS